jgi:hypothetical protein
MSFIYNGQYQDLIDWITDTYSPSQFRTFAEWLGNVKSDFFNSGHHFSDDIKEEMQKLWEDNHLGPLGFKEPLPETNKVNKTYNTITREQIFTNEQVYSKNESRPKASIRRDLSTLVKQGRIERIRTGVYRVK